MITTAVRGHLASCDFTGAPAKWHGCSPGQLLDRQAAPIVTYYHGDMQVLKQNLERLAQRATVLVLWLDCDREGEAIGDEVRTVCCTANPRLLVRRARFSTVLFGEIRNALNHLTTVNEHFVHAVQTRSELDLRVGAALTRLQTLRLQNQFEYTTNNPTGNGSKVLSYGPCQFPTLGFVVERWARIETFEPEDFSYLDLVCRVPQQGDEGDENVAPNHLNGSTTQLKTLSFTWSRGRLFDDLATQVLYDRCQDQQQQQPIQAVVTNLQGRPKSKWRPVPLATVELQKRASRFLRIGAEALMSAAEDLYQQGYITYPRTETEKFRPEFSHQSLLQKLAQGLRGDLQSYANRLVQQPGHFQRPRLGQHDDQAHPPITPCKAVDALTISDVNQRAVYTLVVKHYLACCSRDAVGQETVLTVRIGEDEEFTARGLMVIEKNWLEPYAPFERWSTGQGSLPHLPVGTRMPVQSFQIKHGATAPPQPLTEVELISLMDQHGIGTDATIAQHITTIQDRAYAAKDPQTQRFTPTKLGIALVEGYNQMGYQLNQPDLRRVTEAACNRIANGEVSKEEVLQQVLSQMKDCYNTAQREIVKLERAMARYFPRVGANPGNNVVLEANFSRCGMCQSSMSLKQERGRGGRGNNAAQRKMVYCNTCIRGWSLPRGGVEPKTNGTAPVICPICRFQVIRVTAGDGYTGNGYHVCPHCFSNPPATQHTGNTEVLADFRCFACTHPDCELSRGTTGGDGGGSPAIPVVSKCPFCSLSESGTTNVVTARKNSRGWVLSCNKYVPGQDRCPYTIWLPKEVDTATVSSTEICGNCSQNGVTVRPVTYKWKRGSVPPMWGAETVACVLCDTEFRREFHVSLPQQNQVRPRTTSTAGRGQQLCPTNTGASFSFASGGQRGGRGPAAGRGTRYTNATGSGRFGGGRGGNAAGFVCYRCGQSGHMANACTQQYQ